VLQLTLMLVSAITDALLSLTKFLYNFWVGAVGLGLGDILKPELVLPLIENLPIEQLASHLPEVCNVMLLTWLSVELILALNCVVIVPGLMDSR
jgi:hypothetical protein